MAAVVVRSAENGWEEKICSRLPALVEARLLTTIERLADRPLPTLAKAREKRGESYRIRRRLGRVGVIQKRTSRGKVPAEFGLGR